ncbi:MAG: hypothetical protein ACRDGF_04690 [Chloroflexota bacterium]
MTKDIADRGYLTASWGAGTCDHTYTVRKTRGHEDGRLNCWTRRFDGLQVSHVRERSTGMCKSLKGVLPD